MPSLRSDRMVYLGVVTPLVLAIAALLALCIGGFGVLSAVRTYVGGESLWSKAHAAAVASLRLHAQTGNIADYQRFQDALAVPLGDRTARFELEKLRPDLDAVEAGFLAGEIAPEDIPGAIRLYRYFRHVEFMEEAISAWVEGDKLVEQLQALGLRIHLHVQRGDPPAVLAPLLGDLEVLDGRLISVEKYFSATLGRASRKTQQLLVYVTLALAALLAMGGALFMRSAMRQQMIDRELLMEANQRWELAADAGDLGLFEWHVAQDRFVLDARAAALHGVSDGTAGVVLKRSELRALTHPDDQATLRARLDEAVGHDQLFESRHRILAHGGQVRHIEAVGRLCDQAVPQGMRMVGIFRDVGAELAQARLTLEKQSAERAAQLRMEFLSRLSHELRTPLNAVLGVAQLLRIDPLEPLSANQAKRVRILQESGAHLLRLVEDVFDITRIDAGALVVDTAPTDLMAVVRASLTIVDPERAARQLLIDDRMPQRAVLVKADPQRLQQVFVNLLGNACRHSAQAGRVTLHYREDEQQASVQVCDEGPGMTREQVAQLFEPFRRTVTGGETDGTGLDLLVAKLLLEKMQGTVSVQSDPGRGSCFTVTLARA